MRVFAVAQSKLFAEFKLIFLAQLLDRAVDDELLSILSVSGVHYSMVLDDAGGFKALFIQTDSQCSLFRQYGDVLHLDCAFKVCTVLVK